MWDIRSKTALVTGATSGIGLEACVKLAALGCNLSIVARNRNKGEIAVNEIRARSGSKAIEVLECDFSSQESIRKMAAEFRARHSRLDVLVNNAGAVVRGRRTTIDGFEQTFAVNHLGYFLTTNLLIDLIEKSAPARIVNVASGAHYRATMDFDNLQFEKGGYSLLGAYGRSKLANVLFTAELARRLSNKNVTVNCLHPGVVATNIWAGAPLFLQPILALFKRLTMITPEEGGKRIVFLATSEAVEGKTGGYYENDRLKDPAPTAKSTEIAQRLWNESARLVRLN